MRKPKAGVRVKLYTDWQKQVGEYTEGELIEKVSDGLPFILTESACPSKQRIYTWEVWRVRTDQHVRVAKIAFLLKRGKKSNLEKPAPRKGLDDVFLSVDGKQIY